MHLSQLLHKIDQGTPINFAQLVKKMPKQLDWKNLFTTEQAGKNKQLVTVINQHEFERLLLQSQQPNSRSSAAVHSYMSSHDIRCDSAYMLCLPAQLNTNEINTPCISNNIKVISAHNKTMQPLPFTPSKSAILIENQDCFFQYNQLLKHYTEQLDLSGSDIYFSAGSRILNESFSDLLSRYSQRFCLFDYDLAGLRTMRALRSKYTGETHYLLPNDILTLSHLFTFQPKETQYLLTMLTLCKEEGLNSLADVVQKSNAFMEQEALLHIP